jgi:hypothetical protein
MQSRVRHAIPAYDFWRGYFVEGGREAAMECIEVPEVDWAEGMVYPQGEALSRWRERTWDATLRFARREHAREPIDFFLSYLYPTQVVPEAIAVLQDLGIPCVNFFCDNVREFRSVPPEYRPFALHWVPEFEAVQMYRRAGLAHLHAPMPCWVPPELRNVPDTETEPPTFVGSADILRRDLLGRAMLGGADFVIRGPGWEPQAEEAIPQASRPPPLATLRNQWEVVRRQGVAALARKVQNRLRPLTPPPVPSARVRPAVFGAKYFQVSREAMITIGVNRVPTAGASNHRPLAYSRLRDLEAPMVGACYLTEWTEGLGQLYDLGTEIETYRTAEELVAKLAEMQGDPVRRRRMREKGQRRVLAEHSVARTLRRIAEYLVGSARV